MLGSIREGVAGAGWIYDVQEESLVTRKAKKSFFMGGIGVGGA
jgi:hypothetical protein